jgi:cytidylate kinase
LNNIIVAVDGPAGSGKQRIAKYIAKKYNFFHLDSGILYRRLASYLFKNRINISRPLKINSFLFPINYLSCRNLLSLRKENVGNTASIIAPYPFVRDFINHPPRILVKKKLNSFRGCVVDGRDIGSKVFKEAKIKLFIDVSLKIRAKRRHKPLIEPGEKSIYAPILKEIKLRDNKDKKRKASPLIVAKGAFIIAHSYDFKTTSVKINQIFNKYR